MTSPLPWYKISPFSGYYPCENRTSQETEKNFVEVFRAVTEAKCYWYERLIRIRQFLWRIVMESSVNYTLFLRKKRNCRTSCTSSKKGTSAVLLQSGLNEKWWSDSMKCFYYLQNVQKPLGKREILIWTKIRRIIQRTSSTIWRTNWIPPRTQRKTKYKFINWEEVITRNFIGYALFAEVKFGEEDILITEVEELENLASSKHISEEWVRKKSW